MHIYTREEAPILPTHMHTQSDWARGDPYLQFITEKAEAGDYHEFEDSLDYKVRPCVKNKKDKQAQVFRGRNS